MTRPGPFPLPFAPLHLLVSLGLLGSLACEGQPGSGAQVERRDSAGIEIILTDSPGWEGEEGLELDTRSVLRIGTAMGEEPYLFSGPLRAVHLSSGATVVLDEELDQLRWFDAAGRHVRSVGRSGEGPGEFVHPNALLLLPADSLLVFDEAHPRLTLYDSVGDLAGTWSLEPPPAEMTGHIHYHRPAPFGRLADGRTLHLASRSQGRMGLVRRTAVVLAFDKTGRWLGPLLEFPGGDWWMERIPGGIRSRIRGAADRKAQAATDGNVVYAGNGDEYRIRAYGSDGALDRILGRTVDPTPASRAQVDSALAGWRAEAPDLSPEEERQFERRLSQVERQWEEHLADHETMPAFHGLRTDGAERLWVRTSYHEYHYDVFSPRGVWLGTLHLPAEPLFLGEGEVILTDRDSLGTPFVEIVPLVSSSENVF